MKTLFVFQIQSFTDVVTNSSSELFVFCNNTIEDVKTLLDSVYPNWKSEYEEPVYVKDLCESELETYLLEKIPTYEWDERTDILKEDSIQASWARYFNIPFEKLYRNWQDFNPSVKVPDKNQYFSGEEYHAAWNRYSNAYYLQLVNNWDKLIRPKLGKMANEICLFSVNENPNWDYQEVLMTFATRYHLG